MRIEIVVVGTESDEAERATLDDPLFEESESSEEEAGMILDGKSVGNDAWEVMVILAFPSTIEVLAPCLLPSASGVEVLDAPEVIVASLPEAVAVPVETAVEEGRFMRREEVGTQS
jgi:hypothetical protein